MFRAALIINAALFLSLGVAHAEAPSLRLPLDCSLGEDCFVEDYVDAKTGTGQADYTCGIKSRDGHRGTDFALKSFEMMNQGTEVLASAAGTVAATRDGMPDILHSPELAESIKGRECGNAVRIDHGDGWNTLYCHMKNGSVEVSQGETVEAGHVLGRVGLSGQTNYPHVHITVLKNGSVVDPFNPKGAKTCAPTGSQGLWQDVLDYDRSGLFTAGFSGAVPSFEDVKSGAARADTLNATRDAIVLYGHAFYAQEGDIMTLEAVGPHGPIFSHNVKIERDRAQLFRAYGKKTPEAGWPKGEYQGRIALLRDGRLIAVRHAHTTVD